MILLSLRFSLMETEVQCMRVMLCMFLCFCVCHLELSFFMFCMRAFCVCLHLRIKVPHLQECLHASAIPRSCTCLKGCAQRGVDEPTEPPSFLGFASLPAPWRLELLSFLMPRCSEASFFPAAFKLFAAGSQPSPAPPSSDCSLIARSFFLSTTDFFANPFLPIPCSGETRSCR